MYINLYCVLSSFASIAPGVTCMFFQIYIVVIEKSYEATRSGLLCMYTLCIFTSAERFYNAPVMKKCTNLSQQEWKIDRNFMNFYLLYT